MGCLWQQHYQIVLYAIWCYTEPCYEGIWLKLWWSTKTSVWITHDDVIKWKHFPRYWPFVRGTHRSPVNSRHKGQWHEALMFSLIYARIKGWVNTCEAGDLRRHHAHYEVIVMDTGTHFTKGLWAYDWNLLNNLIIVIIMLIHSSVKFSHVTTIELSKMPNCVLIRPLFFLSKHNMHFTRFGLWAHKHSVKWSQNEWCGNGPHDFLSSWKETS